MNGVYNFDTDFNISAEVEVGDDLYKQLSDTQENLQTKESNRDKQTNRKRTKTKKTNKKSDHKSSNSGAEVQSSEEIVVVENPDGNYEGNLLISVHSLNYGWL